MGHARVTPAEKQQFLKYLAEGWTVEQASQRIGRSYAWGKKFAREMNRHTPVRPAAPANDDHQLRPLASHELSDVALDCLEDFGRFRYRYFGRLSSPWQEDAAYRTKERLATPYKEYGVVNCPPGSGKSTLFTHDIPAWLTCRSRSLRGFIGSSTQTMANSYVGRLRNTLARKIPMQASSEDKAQGIARDAESTLIQDYGVFRPDPTLGAPWTKSQFTVAQVEDTPIGEKEATWTAFGADSEFLGWRVNFIVWDDLVTKKSVQSHDAIQAQRQWWIDEAQTRLEPGGLLILQGQRLHAEDLYKFCLDMRSGYTDLDFHLSELGEEELPEERKYFHIVYKAHYEEHCKADTDPAAHSITAPPYDPSSDSPGCLLDPRRLGWRELSAVMRQPLTNYRVVYQQEDTNPDDVLVPELWLNGGTDPETGELYPGCYDRQRSIGELPSDLSGTKFSLITVDPSPTKYWSIQWWLYVEPPDTQRLMGFRYLIDHVRKPMGADDLLDWVVGVNDYVGLLEDWHKRSRVIGFPFTHLIVERNAAQRFMLQYSWFRRWLTTRSVICRPHDTSSNKADPKYGVNTIRTHYRYGRVRLPGTRDSMVTPDGGVQPLVNELTRYPDTTTDDCVMANWFMEYNLQHLAASHREIPSLYKDMPSWLNREASLA